MIRSTFIAGFPGETEEEFQHLLDFVREAQIDRAGCFAYSDVTGAVANELPGMLPLAARGDARRFRDELMGAGGRIDDIRLAAEKMHAQALLAARRAPTPAAPSPATPRRLLARSGPGVHRAIGPASRA